MDRTTLPRCHGTIHSQQFRRPLLFSTTMLCMHGPSSWVQRAFVPCRRLHIPPQSGRSPFLLHAPTQVQGHTAGKLYASSLLNKRHKKKHANKGVEDMAGKRFGNSFPAAAGQSFSPFVVDGGLPTGRKRLWSFLGTVLELFQNLPEQAAKNKFFARVAWPTFIATLIGTGAVWLQQETGYQGIDTVAHETLGGIVGLLVAFRTNLAYDRWLQGRQALGSVTLHTLDLAAKMAAYLSDDVANMEAIACRRESARLLRLLFSTTIIAVKEATAQVDELSPESGALLIQIKDAAYVDATFLEQRQLADSFRPPFMVLAWLRQHLQYKGTITALGSEAKPAQGGDMLLLTQNGTSGGDVQNLAMSRVFLVERWNDLMVSVNELTISLGQCMSIASTPMPWQYGSINSILLALLVYTFPFALVGSLDFNVIPVSALLAFGYYGMDALSLELRTPYGNTGDTNFIINQDWLTDVHGEINTALLSTCPTNPALSEEDGTAYKYLQQSQTLYGRDTEVLRDGLASNTWTPAEQPAKER